MFEKLGHQFVRCDGCKLEAIAPQPSDETLGEIYGAHYYDAWGLHDNESVVGDLKRRTFEYVMGKMQAPARSGARLLDCGAATGFLLEVAQKHGFDVYGLELSDFGAKEIARKFGQDHVFCGELENLAFANVPSGAAFDAVTMCDYIEHVRDPRKILSLAHDLLAPGGQLAITTPDAGSPSHTVLRNGWTHYKVEHLFYFNRNNLETLLKDLGFTSVKFYPLWKSLTLDYISHQFDVYPHKAITPVARGIRKFAPALLRKQPLPFSTGELLAVATR